MRLARVRRGEREGAVPHPGHEPPPDQLPDGHEPDEHAAGGTDARRGVDCNGARDALARVTHGEAFARSRRNRDLLAHLVTETIEGRAKGLNGTTVAQDVLGKGADFDPASDPSVRVQMGRLRRLLDVHYAGEGARDPVRIVLAKASYVPRFVAVREPLPREPVPREPVPPEPVPPATALPGAASDDVASDDVASDGAATSGTSAGMAAEALPGGANAGGNGREAVDARPQGPARSRSRSWSRLRSRSWSAAGRWPLAALAGLAALVVLAVLAAGTLREPRATLSARDYPAVIVHRFENRTGEGRNDVVAAGFQRQFAADLQRFQTARVTLNTAPSGPSVPSPAADFTVTGAILRADDTLDAIVWLIDLHDTTIAATERLAIEADGTNYVEALEEFSRRLAAHVAAPRGRLAQAAREHFGSVHLLSGENGLSAFECFIAFNEFTANRTNGRFAPVHDCLSREVGRRPEDGTLLAALGWMELLGSREAGLMEPAAIGRHTSLVRAAELVERAVSVAPANDVAHLHHGLVNWFMGNEAVAIDSMRRAVRLNPADPQHKADYGMFLTYTGDWEEGLGYVEEAIEWDLDPPGWYFLPRYFDALLNGRLAEAERVLDGGAVRGDPFEPVYRFALAGLRGDAAAVERWRPGVEALAERNGGDPLAPLRHWVRLPAILDLFEDALRGAGIAVNARAA